MKTKAEPIDMSPEAIARRLDDVRGLYRLCMSLMRARIIGPTEALESQGSSRRSDR